MKRSSARFGAGVLTLTAFLLTTAGCQRPLVPSSAPVPHNSARTTAPPLHHHRRPILGVDLYAKSNYPRSVVRTDGKRDLRYAKRKLKVSSVGIAWNLFAPSNHSDRVVRSAETLTPANVALLTRMAKDDGLSVLYRPLVKLQAPKQWEGYVAPADTARWFASYFRAELPYLRLAQKYHVSEFVMGTELVQLEQSAPRSQWQWLVRKVGEVYHGRISYATWGHHYFPASRVLPPTQWYGVTAYQDFALPDTAPVSRLIKAWMKTFRPVPLAIRSRTAIEETGIPAGDGAYHHPWAWTLNYVLNETVQARFFLSVCYVTRALHLRAIYFWNLNLTNDPAHPPFPSPVTFEGKRGAVAIRQCAHILAGHG